MRTHSISIARALGALLLLIAGPVALAAPATAAGGETGVLLLKGPGYVYGGQGTAVSQSVAAGTAASYAFEIRNTGSSTAQFNLKIARANVPFCAGPCSATVTVTTGSLVVTTLAAGPNGYFTAPIAPGAVATYTLKLTPNKTGATPGDDIAYSLQLNDTAGNQLGMYSVAYVNIIRNTGTSGADQFVSATGGTPVTSGNAHSWGLATAPSVAVNKTFTFTVKLKNDGTAPSAITWGIKFFTPTPQCAAYFPIKVKQGTTDVTSAALADTYTTPTLAHGASVSLTVTGTSLSGGWQCLQTGNQGLSDWLTGTSDSAGEHTTAVLLFSPATL